MNAGSFNLFHPRMPAPSSRLLYTVGAGAPTPRHGGKAPSAFGDQGREAAETDSTVPVIHLPDSQSEKVCST